MQGRRVTIEAKVLVGSGGMQRVVKRKTWHQIDVMKLSKVKAWVRRQFNIALKQAEKDIQVGVSYYGQLQRDPFTAFSGELGGVNGKTLRASGGFSLYD